MVHQSQLSLSCDQYKHPLQCQEAGLLTPARCSNGRSNVTQKEEMLHSFMRNESGPLAPIYINRTCISELEVFTTPWWKAWKVPTLKVHEDHHTACCTQQDNTVFTLTFWNPLPSKCLLPSPIYFFALFCFPYRKKILCCKIYHYLLWIHCLCILSCMIMATFMQTSSKVF